MEILESIYLIVKTVLLVIFSTFMFFIILKINSILEAFDSYIRQKEKISIDNLRMDRLSKALDLIVKERDEISDKSITAKDIEEYLKKWNIK